MKSTYADPAWRCSEPMPLADIPAAARAGIRFILTDIDDTLTSGGRLTAAAYGALERLAARGYRVIPVTGRPAYVTTGEAGAGFVEFAEMLLS